MKSNFCSNYRIPLLMGPCKASQTMSDGIRESKRNYYKNFSENDR